jgi:hypothetical protein
MSHSLCPWEWQLYCTASLHPPGHLMTAAMLRDLIKGTFCRCIYEGVSLVSYYLAANVPLHYSFTGLLWYLFLDLIPPRKIWGSHILHGVKSLKTPISSMAWFLLLHSFKIQLATAYFLMTVKSYNTSKIHTYIAVILFYSTFYCLELRLFMNIWDYIFSSSNSYKGPGMSFMMIFSN